VGLATLFLMVVSRPAAAQVSVAPPSSLAAMSSSCPSGNLLAGMRPVHWQDIARDLSLITDGVVSPEGASWDAPLAVILGTQAASLTYDFGAVVPLKALYVQADANDTYQIWGSRDGRQYQPLAQVEVVEGVHGLRSRKVDLPGIPIRLLRFGEGLGDSYYALSELQAFCKIPDPFPPTLEVRNTLGEQVKTSIYTYWNNDISSRWEMVLAALGYVLLAWGANLARSGKAHLYRNLRDRLLAAAGVVSFLTYFNFGFFHFPNFTHDWEWTHYYLGSKYFNELSYDKLYECIAVADAEDGLRRRVELRKITNLRTNLLETSADILAHPERCKSKFTDKRWIDFKHDVSFFRGRQTPRRWEDLQSDHGYNATPVWNIAGSLLSNLAPAMFQTGVAL
jgi:hypothetical protein